MSTPPLCTWLMAVGAIFSGCSPSRPATKPPIRVAVIGGMVMTGVWQEMTKHFEADTGYRLKVTAVGNKQILVESFRKGEADFLTMHATDDATDLVADGYATGLTPWARNELVIVGPPEDPAHIKGLTNGATALRQIAEAHAPYVDFFDAGSRQVSDKLWKQAGITPKGDWVLKDESKHGQEVVLFAEQHHAYVIVGRIPVVSGKMDSGAMQIMVRGDPEMRRPFVVMVATIKRFPKANITGAQVLANYLTSPKAQHLLKEFAAKQPDGIPLFYPISAE